MLLGPVLRSSASECVEFQTDANSLWCCTGGTIAQEDATLDLQDKYYSTIFRAKSDYCELAQVFFSLACTHCTNKRWTGGS